ncbi:MAG: zinc ribbon domain-containing protein [Clostridia bacterium]|nr:zinc ribbon domain-containing protein [Clostridia bacterium]
MEFFDKLGRKASEAYKVTADKTGKIAKETKLKLKMTELKSQINDIYEEIGKKVYEQHIREEDISIEKDLEESCTKIDVLSDEIDSLLKQCLDLKDKKQCPNCYVEIEKEVKFCPNCGEKQVDEQPKEVEVLEDLENSEIEEDNEKEKIIVEEELRESLDNKQENNNQKSDLVKTVEVESDVEVSSLDTEEEIDNLEKTVEIESNVENEESNDEEKQD